MAAEEDGDVFEITDFTTASEWERFVARLEEVLHEWKLVNRDPLPAVPAGKFTDGPWEEKTEEVAFADFKFHLTYTCLKSSAALSEAESRSSRERDEGEEDSLEEEHKTPTVFTDLISMDNDFPSRAHCLCRWYGLQEFLVIQPAPNVGIIDSESRAKILESSVAVALSNSVCHVPTFVQLQQKWRKLYSGISVVPGASVDFEMSHLRKIPSQYLHLAGLLDVFKAKLGCAYISMPPVSVSVRFTYILEDWIHCPWPQTPPDFSSFAEGEVGYSELDVLPFGACEDPVSELHLSCTWPSLSEHMIVENNAYSDLDPLQAPQWSVRIQMTEDPQCLLGQYLRDFLQLCSRTETTDEILGRLLTEGADQGDKEGAEDITHALQRLTEPNLPYHIPSLTTVVSNATTRLRIKPEEAPIPPRLLNQILLHMFPDATGLLMDQARRDKAQAQRSRETTPSEETPPIWSQRLEEISNEAAKQLKSAPPDSLTYRMAVCFAIINHNHGGLHALAHLWQEFILEMRYRWENNILIPDLGITSAKSDNTAVTPTPASPSSPSGGVPQPNLGSCLLHQKLQMLNCCIERKVKRESAGYGHEDTLLHEAPSSVFESGTLCGFPDNDEGKPDNDAEAAGNSPQFPQKPERIGSMGSSSDDEFFECDDGDENEEEKEDGEETALKKPAAKKKSVTSERSMDSSVSELSFKDSLPSKPEGRMAQMKNMKSLATGEPLYIPITQEPSPMTEDMLEEHAEVLAKLGSSAEGSQLRARMQSACLLSDMESFKSANPGCILEDFVRWYSPRDYVEDEDEMTTSTDDGAKGSSVDDNNIDSSGAEDEEEKDSSVDTSLKPLTSGSMHKRVNAADSNILTTSTVTSRDQPKRKGRLSQRMQIPGNMWVEVWQSARPVPARRQKRLFDDTKEAEKVLHFLAGLRPGEVVLHLLPMLIHASVLKLAEMEDPDVPVQKTFTDQVLAKAAKVTRLPHLPDAKRYEDVIRMIELAETVSSRAQSLKTKFTRDLLEKGKAEEELHHFVASLLQQPEVMVRGGPCGPAGSAIHKLFVASQKAAHMILEDEDKCNADATGTTDLATAMDHLRPSSTVPDFPNPSAREYILRAMVPRPAPYSRVLPQRMYCVLVDGDYRLAGAFCSDTTFQ